MVRKRLATKNILNWNFIGNFNIEDTIIRDVGHALGKKDEKLLEKTGGIVQGMSGSPIVQGDKIIGADIHLDFPSVGVTENVM